MIKDKVSEAFDITYNEDRTIINMHGMAEAKEPPSMLHEMAKYKDLVWQY